MIYKLLNLFHVSSLDLILVFLNLSSTEKIRVGVDTKSLKCVEIYVETHVFLKRSGIDKLGISLCPQMRWINLAFVCI